VKAIGFWRQACSAAVSSAESCAYLGAGYLRGSGVMRDDVRAGQYLSQGCEAGFAPGCTWLASMYESGSTVTAKSVTRAAEFYKRGCDGGDQKACAWVRANPQPVPAKK
jgi:TPR repeat protein